MKSEVPSKLIFSPQSPGRKKRAYRLIAILVLVQLGLIWPVFPIFSSPTPLILGFPLPFAWAILMLLGSFTSLLVFFLNDNQENGE